MEDPGEEWEIEKYSTSGEEVSQSKISRILSGGLWLGKKVVITGFVISSAPVVLPPLVVVSALGFAVSIPAGVVLASYTCTEKLMNKLLPIPQSSETLDYGAPLIMDKAEEFVMEEEEKTQIQDTEERVEMRIELVEDGNREQQQENMMPATDPNSERNATIEDQSYDLSEVSLVKEIKDEKPQPVVARVVVARPVKGESAGGKREAAEVLKMESTGLLEKIRDEGKSEESAKKHKKKNKDRLRKSLGLGGKKEDRIARDTKEMKNSSQSRDENLNKFAAGTGSTDTTNTDEISTEDRNIEISGETTKDAVLDHREHAPVTEKPVESQSIFTNGSNSEEKSEFVNEGVNHRERPGNQEPHVVEAAKASTEIFPSEKKLWEQINAIRLIVGYKANRHPSLTEELNALYVFTGVEPPSSFEDSGNIRDDADKLRFLMSIVGVK